MMLKCKDLLDVPNLQQKTNQNTVENAAKKQKIERQDIEFKPPSLFNSSVDLSKLMNHPLMYQNQQIKDPNEIDIIKEHQAYDPYNPQIQSNYQPLNVSQENTLKNLSNLTRIITENSYVQPTYVPPFIAPQQYVTPIPTFAIPIHPQMQPPAQQIQPSINMKKTSLSKNILATLGKF
jgi:hypothetical protein